MTETARPVKVRWFRRRPPAGMPTFARRVWWAGHAQLFLAPAAAVVGAFLLLGGDVAFLWGALLISMAPPFVTSGLMLRAQGLRQATLAGRSWAGRVAEFVAAVVGIAALSVVFVIVDVWVLWFALLQMTGFAGH
jgi:hypothetical protein